MPLSSRASVDRSKNSSLWFSVLFGVLLLSIIALRLGIWKFFPDMEFAVKDEFSNLVVAGSIYAAAAIFFSMKFLRKEPFFKHGLEGPLAVFIAMAVVSWHLTADPAVTLRAIVILNAYVLFFWMLTESLASEISRQVFFWFFIAASVVVAGFGINDIIYLNSVPASEIEAAHRTNESLYYILVFKRACSLFGWPNVLAGFLTLGMPLATGLCLSSRHWILKIIAAVALVGMLTAFYFTFSVLGWTVFVLTMVAMFFICWRTGVLKIPAFWKKWIYAGGVVMLALFLLVLVRKDYNASMAPRKEYIRVVKKVIADHPLRGSGFGAYRAASLRYVNNAAGVTGFAHNSYLQVWAETGIIGFAALLWMIFLLARAAFRSWNSPRPWGDQIMLGVVLWGMLAFLIDNLNSFTMLKPNSSFFFWTWLAVTCSFIFPRSTPLLPAKTFERGLMVILVLASCVGFWISGRGASYFYWLQQGISLVNNGDNKMGRLFLARAQPFDPLDVKVWTVRGMAYLKDFQTSAKKRDLDEARRSFERAASLAPNFYHSFFILSRIHAYQGEGVLAEKLKQQAFSISPFEVTRDLQNLARTGGS